MATGTVMLYDEANGYGVIRPDGGGDAVFVLAADMGKAELRSLGAGWRIEFNLDREVRVVTDPRLTSDVRANIKARFESLLGSYVEDEATIVESARLVEDLHIDNLDLIEIVMSMEGEFGIPIPDGTVEGIKTVGDALNFVERTLIVSPNQHGTWPP